MSSKRAIRRRACIRKKQFFSQHEAQHEANRLWQRGVHVRAYECSFGNHWHIGHMPRALKLNLAQRKERNVA